MTGINYFTVYCDRNTREAFRDLFSEMFRIIIEITGKPLKLKAFWPDDGDARCCAILLDAEDAQIKGLGDSLSTYVANYAPSSEAVATLVKSPTDLVLRVLKLCVLHFER